MPCIYHDDCEKRMAASTTFQFSSIFLSLLISSSIFSSLTNFLSLLQSIYTHQSSSLWNHNHFLFLTFSSMAITLESAIIPHHSDLRMALSASAKTNLSPVFAIFSHRRVGELREFTGLKLQLPSKKAFASIHGRSSRPLGRRRAIVSEAQGTVLDVPLPAVTDSTWQSLVLKADGPVLVEFYASWCGPCRIIHPVVSELSQQYEGKLKCYKLNTDESPSIATQYGIRSIPTIMILINGEKKDSIMGVVPKTTLAASIEKFL